MRKLVYEQRRKPIPITGQTFDPMTIPKRALMQEVTPISISITEQITVPILDLDVSLQPPTHKIGDYDPYVPPPPPPPGIPLLFPTFKFIWGRPKKRIGRRVRRRLRMPTRYTPSLVGVAMGRYARREPIPLTGIGIRPLIRRRKKKRKGGSRYSMNKIFGM